LYRLT